MSAAVQPARSVAVPMLALVYLRQFSGVLSGINIFNLSGIVFLISIVVIGTISLITRPPGGESVRPMLWRPGLVALPEAEVKNGYPWWRRISLWFGVVVAVFIIIYIIFW